jgi:putative membrane protein
MMSKKQPAFWAKTCFAAAFIFHLVTSSAFAQTPGHSGWHMGPSMSGDWGMGWFGFILVILFFLIVLVGIGALIRWLIQQLPGSKQCQNLNNGSKAFAILRERYARGEISHEEFESMKKDLSQ